MPQQRGGEPAVWLLRAESCTKSPSFWQGQSSSKVRAKLCCRFTHLSWADPTVERHPIGRALNLSQVQRTVVDVKETSDPNECHSSVGSLIRSVRYSLPVSAALWVTPPRSLRLADFALSVQFGRTGLSMHQNSSLAVRNARPRDGRCGYGSACPERSRRQCRSGLRQPAGSSSSCRAGSARKARHSASVDTRASARRSPNRCTWIRGEAGSS